MSGICPPCGDPSLMRASEISQVDKLDKLDIAIEENEPGSSFGFLVQVEARGFSTNSRGQH